MTATTRSHNDYTIGWICPLEVEQIAALEMLDEEHEPLPQPINDHNSYTLGRIRNFNIVVAGLPTTGNCSTATVVAHLRGTFPRVRFGLLVGIGGGVPTKTDAGYIRLGDIVVSKPTGEHSGVLQYDHGKAEAGQFRRTGFLAPPPNVLLNAAQRLAVNRARAKKDPLLTHLKRIDISVKGLRRYKYPGRSKDNLYQPDYLHIDRNLSCEKCGCDDSKRVIRDTMSDEENEDNDINDHEQWVTIHRGTIASGELVIKDGKQRDDLARQYDLLCFEMEAAGAFNDFPCLVIRGISDYCDSHKDNAWHGYAAATAAAYARELFFHLPIAEAPQCKIAEDDVQQLMQDTRGIAQVTLGTNTSVEEIATRSLLSKLSWAEGATYDAFEESDELNQTCLEDTRVALFEEIQAWIDEPTGKTLFWLNGMAGTGKSTISRTLAKDLQRKKQLGASFFFKTGQGDRGGAKRFFTTLAFQLAQAFPSLLAPIRQVLEVDDPHVSGKSINEQFDKLILGPLTSAAGHITTPVIMVIDALDECKPEAHAETILSLFSKLRDLQSLRVRVFLTSRPERELRTGFGNITPARYQDIILHQIPQPVITHDIEVFLRYRFQLIRGKHEHDLAADWPGEAVLSTLVARAQPLFIFAATICRFIGDPRHDPEARLQSILADQDDQAYDKIHNTYEPILNRLIDESTNNERNEVRKNFRRIVGSIVLLFEPLSLHSLSHLLSVNIRTIRKTLDGLHSVLRVLSSHTVENNNLPVTILHLSFADFLLDSRRQDSHQFWVDSADVHQDLARQCLDLLLSASCPLKQDICSVKLPGIFRVNIDTALVDSHLPLEIQYACRYWIMHLEKARHCYMLEYSTHKFLHESFLHWFEAMSLLGRAWEVGPLISNLSTAMSGSQNLQLKAIIRDARRFVLANCYVADLAPLQIYHSGLIFSPQHSIIRGNNPVPDWMKVLPEVDSDWGPILQTLIGHVDEVTAVSFSCDAMLIASASKDCDIRLWDAATGQLRSILKGHSEPIGSMAWSPVDPQLLVSFGEESIVNLWDAISEQSLQTTKFPWDNESSEYITWSPNGQTLALTNWTGPVQIWDVVKWERQQFLQISNEERYWTSDLAFSNDGKLFFYNGWRRIDGPQREPGSNSHSKQIYIWNAVTWQLQRTITTQMEDYYVYPPTIWPMDDNLIAVALDNLVKLFDAQTGRLRQVLQPEIGSMEACSIAFSHNGKLFAIARADLAIDIWRTESDDWRLQKTLGLNVEQSTVTSMAFSLDDQTLAYGTDSHLIKFWDISEEQLNTKDDFEELNGQVTGLALSHYGKTLAIGHWGPSSLSLWNVASERSSFLRMLEFDADGESMGAMAFSGDDMKLAAIGFTNFYIWDLSTEEPYPQLQGERLSRAAFSIAFSLNGKLVACGCVDQVEIWDVSSGPPLLSTKLEAYGIIHAVAFSADSTIIAFGGDHHDIKIHDVVSGLQLQHIRCHEAVERLWFDADAHKIGSNVGIFPLSPEISYSSTQTGRPADILAADGWLLRDGQAFLWLPPEYRRLFASHRGLVILGTSTATVTILEVSLEELDKALVA